MKKIIGIAVFSLLILTGCKKFDEKTQFTYSIEEDVTIPSNVGVNIPFNVPTTDVKTNIDHELEIRNKKKKRIEHIYLTKLELFIKSPSSANFNFLKDVSIQLEAEGLPKTLVAQQKNLQNTNTSYLSIPTIENNDIAEYIKKDKVNIHVDVVTDETIFQNITITVKPTFWVDVKVLGI